MAKIDEVVTTIKEKFPQAVEETVCFRDEHTIRVKREHLLEVSHFLK